MRRERVIQAGTCHHLVARVAKGESKGARRYDNENLLWQSTVAIKSDPVGFRTRWGAFFFVASELADVPSACLTLTAAKPPRG